MKTICFLVAVFCTQAAIGQQPQTQQTQQPQAIYWLPVEQRWTPVRNLICGPQWPVYAPYTALGPPYTIQYQPVAPAQFVPMGGVR